MSQYSPLDMESYLQLLFQSPSRNEWYRFAAILFGITTTIGISEGVRLLLHWPPEFTRKLVHISVAILIFFAPNMFVSAIPPLALATSFTLVAYIAIKLGLLRSLHAVSRGSYGTVYYPLAFLILILMFWNSHAEIVSLSMLALGIGDASAAIVGESIKKPRHFRLTGDKKSIQGSIAMVAATAVSLMIGMLYFDGSKYSTETIASAIVCSSLIAAAWEALSSRALDNLTIPLSVGFVLFYVLVPSPLQDSRQLIVGVVLGIIIAVAAYFLKFLKASGAVATFLLASLVYGVGGWKWTIPILAFFVLSSMLTKIGKSQKKESELLYEKPGARDVGQVAANGGVAGIVVLLQYVFQNFDFYPIYLGAVAAVTADTWGTEIGTYVRGKTVSIITMRTVNAGVSGGISIAGLIGGMLGAAVITVSAVGWITSARVIVVAIVAGIVGSLADSILGGTIQVHYRCDVCGKSTERSEHCGAPTVLSGGIRWINNDFVNWTCAMVGAFVACALV